MKTIKEFNAFRRPGLARAVLGALATLGATTAIADPLLTVKIFRDSDIMFRDSDMARYAENYVELGAGYNSNDSFKFGQWSGLTDQGMFAIAGFNWISRKDAEDSRYVRLYGANLGLASRKLLVETGHQGRWNVSAGVDQLQRSEVDDAYFIHSGLGSANLTAPYLASTPAVPVATAATTNSANANIQGRLRQYDIVQYRNIHRLGINGQINDQWDVRVNLREDRRDGTRLTGMYFSTGVGMIVPYAQQDHTQQVDLMASYNTKNVQFQAGYLYSRYENEHDAFNAVNPFQNPLCQNTPATLPATTCAAITGGTTQAQLTSSNAEQGRLSLNPDNEFHQLLVNGAYNLNKTTRFTAQATYGIATQNQAYLPYTANAGVPASNLDTVAGLPASARSLDGKVIYTTADFAAILRPMDKMNVKLAYQFRDNDNQTARQQFQYVSRDSTTQCAAGLTASCFRQNAPMSTTEHRLLADGDYEIFSRTVLRLGYEHRLNQYTLADRTETTTDKVFAEVRRPVSDEFLGSAGISHSQRRGEVYDKNVYFNETYTDNTFKTSSNANAGRLTQHPSTRAYLFSSYDENRARLAGNWAASETISFQTVLDGYRQETVKQHCATTIDPDVPLAISSVGTPGIPAALPDVCLGRDSLQGGSLALDLQWQAEENLTTFAFANVAMSKTSQIGRAWSRATTTTTGNTTTTNITGATAPDWFADVTYSDRAFGAGIKWQPVEKWDLGGTYVFSSSNEKIDLAQAGATLTPYPETNSTMHSLQLFAKWDYSKALTWRFNYVVETLRYTDWQYNNANAGSNSSVLFTGQNSPQYTNHVFGVSASLKTW